MLFRSYFAFVATVGRILANVELNRIEKRETSTGAVYAKRRLWYAGPVIVAGNVYLKIQRARLRVCLDAEWRAWAAQAYGALHGVRVKRNGRNELLFPALEGQALAAILASPDHDLAFKLRALISAVRALERSHQVWIVWPDDRWRRFSHGDATARNVLCDMERENARWFDFETIHDGHLSEPWRHADDLRALLYSSAEYLECPELPAMCRTVVHSYRNTDTLAQLREMIQGWRRRPIVYHLAQGRLGFEKRTLMDSLLFDGLGGR